MLLIAEYQDDMNVCYFVVQQRASESIGNVILFFQLLLYQGLIMLFTDKVVVKIGRISGRSKMKDERCVNTSHSQRAWRLEECNLIAQCSSFLQQEW